MPLPYLCETVLSPDGVPCAVLDTPRVDFSVAARGRKRAHTLVREAKGGEEIVTRNALGQVETAYVARQGDAIFCNMHNPDDTYVPGHADGTRWKFSELTARGCEVVETRPESPRTPSKRHGRFWTPIRNRSPSEYALSERGSENQTIKPILYEWICLSRKF
jgi:hypothetical protein